MPEPISCGKPTVGVGPIRSETEKPALSDTEQIERRSPTVTARVGRPAPDFKAEGYMNGDFKAYQLSEFRGQWVLLCFYPGDFTFL